MRYGSYLFFAAILIALASCTSSRIITQKRQPVDFYLDTSTVLSSGFSGLHIVDIQSGQVLFSRNANKYFVPASNTKIFTLNACLHNLGDSILALKYVETDTSFTFWGTGDPTLLHPYFPSSPTIDFLKSKAAQKKLWISYAHCDLKPYGEGWMWDDYNDYYQTELTSFPIYGNVLKIKKDSSGISGQPDILMNRLIASNRVTFIKRNEDNNLFLFPTLLDTIKTYEQQIPYKNAEIVNLQILESILNTKIGISQQAIPKTAKTFYSLPKDTVLRRMMQVSDNMLAEQLLLLSGMAVGDTISPTFAIQQAKEKYLNALSQPPHWVDGSGLSRYNMMTPISITELLKTLYHTFTEKSIYSFMAVGGINGTVKNLFKNGNDPYVFAKSGTLSGAYNLSGYLHTKKGRKLIFSFMNNNFSTSTSQVRKEVENILNLVRNNY
jgi:D-alanyl-D-alanine carboxypeptidase/D-alanyl-D-alanine-endopeptidase (penicillin-binding protein 4)